MKIDFKTKLDSLLSNNKITTDERRHFLTRGIQYEKFNSKYPSLEKIFPDGIPIGASKTFIENLDFPYQETSFVCASANLESPKTYLYKTNDGDGGVTNLSGGTRSVGDNVFASLNRIILGNHAIIISADNLIANSEHIWNWEFFGKLLKKDHYKLYEELKHFNSTRPSFKKIQVIVARKKNTFERLGFVEKYQKNQIAVFNSNDVDVVILTNNDGYEFASKSIEPSSQIHYIAEDDELGNMDIKKCLKQLRKKFGVKKMLNDGGRKMSNGMRDLHVLGGERITYEPFPGSSFLPKRISQDMVLGKDGSGIDGSPIEQSLVAFSNSMAADREELMNLHLYPMLR